MKDQRWRIQLFGPLQVQQGDTLLHRFATQKTGLLLAYLAYYSRRAHPREPLIAILWPDVDLTTGRNRFKQAFASLRRQLESGRSPDVMLLTSDRLRVGVDPERITTDVAEFHALLRQSAQAASAPEQKALLGQAVKLYQGDLLADYYEEWVLLERPQHAAAYFHALQQLVQLCREAGEGEEALAIAHRALAIDPFEESVREDLITLYQALGRPAEALRQYQVWERLLQEELGTAPSRALQALAHKLRTDPAAAPSTTAIVLVPRDSRPTLPLPYPEARSSGPLPRLPVPRTRFFGRTEESARLETLLQPPARIVARPSERLVTLTGAGGTGKTRLALEVAHCLVASYRERVWMVTLADLSDPALVANALADALLLRRSHAQEPMEQVVAYLAAQSAGEGEGNQPILLLLDNLEHLLPEGARLIGTLLNAIPSLVCLVTSRCPLHLAGEREIALAPLPLPPDSNQLEPLSEVPSVQLFVDRAQARRADFTLTPHNAGVIAALCQRLEGLPLAIELAAGWTKTLTPTQIQEQLNAGAALLTSHQRDISPRHASLRAAIAWSVRLLSPDQETYFLNLSVFRGSWTLEAAAAVCVEPQALAFLHTLCEHSLVIPEEAEGQMRYRLLETLRQYGESVLRERGNWEACVLRHRAYYLEGLDRWEDVDVAQELDNLRAALDRCLSAPVAAEAALDILRQLSLFLSGKGFWEEERRVFARLLEADLMPPQRIKVLGQAALLAIRQGDYPRARPLCEEALALAQDEEGRPTRARLWSLLAAIYEGLGDYDRATSLFQRCLKTYREVEGGDPYVAGTLHNLGCVAQAQGEYRTAQVYQEESLALYRRLQLPGGIGMCLGFLGDLARLQGDWQTAAARLEESLALFQQYREYPRVAEMEMRLGALLEEQGDLARARALLQDSLLRLLEIGDRPHLTSALLVRAWVALAEGDFRLGATLYGAAQALRDTLQMPLPQAERQRCERELPRLKEALGDAALEDYLQAGCRLTWEAAVRMALTET
jgi:predicted ATPase/DNA-binding SARP family transcriptional activator